MQSSKTAVPRNHLIATALLLAALLCAAFAVAAGAARAETTTTGTDAAGTTVPDVTVTTTADTSATTAPGDTTATTAAGDTTATTTAAPGDGLTPAPAGFTPPNPGLLAAQLGVQFWPEYDTNDVLVLLDVTLPATTVFPYDFSFFVPKGARLAGLAEIDENGNFDYTLGTPRVTTGDTMDMVTVTVPSRTVLRLEYYFDPGVQGPGAKSYTLSFQVPADAGQLSVGVQQPLGSSGFSAGQSLTQTSTDAEGFTYYFGSFAGVKAGDLLEIPVAYTRSDPDPSRPPGAVNNDPQTQRSSNYLLWLLIVLVLAVGAIVAYRLIFRGTPAPAGARSGAARGGAGGRRPAAGSRSGGGASKRAAPPAESGVGPARFCTQCGGRLTKKDRFCPQCGHERES